MGPLWVMSGRPQRNKGVRFPVDCGVVLIGRIEQFRATFLWTSLPKRACVVEADRLTDL